MVAPTSLTNGVRVHLPPSGGVTIPQGFNYRSLQVLINLTTADKLMTGSTLELEVYFSFNGGATWQFISGYPPPPLGGGTWKSYGPSGYTVTDPDGTVHVNPDPTIYVPLNGVTGQLFRIEYVANALTTAGATVYGIS